MNPYLKTNRLQDVVATLQFLGSYKDYKLSVSDWEPKLENRPVSAGSWKEIFDEHPEFFRTNDKYLVSLMWRRTMPHDRYSRKQLSQEQIATLIHAALEFHAKAHEQRRDRRWWIPLLAALMAFAGAVLGGWIRAGGSGRYPLTTPLERTGYLSRLLLSQKSRQPTPAAQLGR